MAADPSSADRLPLPQAAKQRRKRDNLSISWTPQPIDDVDVESGPTSTVSLTYPADPLATAAGLHLPKTPGLLPPPPLSGDEDDDVDVDEAPPEMQLAKLAMRVAVMEKTATMVGKLSFLWATVVILGGFASISKRVDFAFVTAILVMEGFRIFVRSHELELRHQGSGNVTIFVTRIFRSLNSALSLVSPNSEDGSVARSKREDGGRGAGSGRTMPVVQQVKKLGSARRSFARISFLPFLPSVFRARRVMRFLYALEVLAALVSIILSVARLVHNRDFADPKQPVNTIFNQRFSLFIFYGLTVVEALLFLVGHGYWQYKMKVRDILNITNAKCRLQDHDRNCHTIRRFFYDVYGKCLEGSVFEGLRMDLVNYTLRWLHSDGPDAHKEHLLGLKALLAMVTSGDSKTGRTADEAMRRRVVEAMLTSSEGAIERLLDMITWRDAKQTMIREAAALLLSKFVDNSLVSVRVGSVPGSVESIAGLLAIDDERRDRLIDKLEDAPSGIAAGAGFERSESLDRLVRAPHAALHVQLGLRILIKLAYRNEVNCSKIGATRGLLAALVSFIDISCINQGRITTTPYAAASSSYDQGNILLLSLTLLRHLASCNGLAGKTLRNDIAKVVTCIPYLRDILQYGSSSSCATWLKKEDVLEMKQRAAEILSYLAMDDGEREVISATGGIMHALFALFLADIGPATPQSDGVTASAHRIARLKLATTAGRTLGLLSLHNERNCGRMLQVRLPEVLEQYQLAELDVGRRRDSSSRPAVDVVDALMEKIGDGDRGHLALFILRNFWDGAGGGGMAAEEGYRRRIAEATPQVLGLVMDGNVKAKIKEAAIGLAAKTMATSLQGFGSASAMDVVLRRAKTSREGVVKMLIELLETYKGSSIMKKLPRLRRSCLELTIALIDADEAFVPLFRNNDFGRYIHDISASTSNLENFATFSGHIGLSLHRCPMEELLHAVADKLHLQQKLYA